MHQPFVDVTTLWETYTHCDDDCREFEQFLHWNTPS